MKPLLPGLCLAALLLLQACSGEAWKRSAHGAVELRGQIDCQREMQQDCRQPESYDSYQRKRKQAMQK